MWRWPDNVEAVIDRWGTGEPNSSNEKCGGVFKDQSTLFDSVCDWQIAFYCMEVYDLVLIQQNKTFEEALDYCRENYADLASLYTDKIMDKAMVITTAAQTDDVWTGLRFLAGQWFWVKGEDLQYKAWSVDADFQCPVTGQHCGAVKRDIKVWELKNCEERLNFLCVE
ncbi:snaclec 7-like [Misgurnus anguillicaudatus]|uniref:snaclec 7-like n=1 Tax=Misgurnus anguillicaudatus TaxID=75329 RepID=UPI003CCF2589